MLVHHGSKELFNSFDYSKIGLNGTSEGKGFYFTDNINIALGYGGGGFVYTVEFNGKKPLQSDKKTITRQQLKKYLKALDEKTDYLSNWGDKNYGGLEKVLNEAVRGEFENSDNDVDLVASITNGSGDMETSLTLLHQLLGYDSIIEDAEWGNQRLYIALTNEIIEVIDIKKVDAPAA